MKHLLKLFVFLIASNLNGQNCGFTISVPQDITICEESAVVLNGMISGSYFGFEWNGTDGYFDDTELSPTVFVSQTTTYTLSVVSSPTTNLIVNGDFSGGNSGFSTDYNYVVDLPNSQSEMNPEGTYTVINNPNLVHNGFVACSDHTGGGNMMVVNGAAAFQQVWCQTVPVMPNSTYIFQAFATSVNPGSPAILQFSIDGLLLGSPFGLSGSTCDWEEFNETWNSGGNTSVEICITNQNTALGGNDFAIDDIFFGALCEDEKQFTVTLSTFELLPPTFPSIDCNNPEALLTAVPVPEIPGYQYDWNTGNGVISSNPNLQQITVITGGEYFVTVTNQAGCTFSQQYEVTADFENPLVDIEGDLTLDCTQKTTLLTANSSTGTVGYIWTLPNATQLNGANITATSPGNYSVSITGINGCTGLDTVTVILENSTIKYAADSTGSLTCSVKSVDIFLDILTIEDSIIWNGPKIIDQNLNGDSIKVGASGYYVFEIFLGIDCSVKDSIYISELPPALTYDLNVQDTLNCNISNTNIFIQNAIGVLNTKWYHDNQLISDGDTITVNAPGIYYSVLTDMNGCTKTDSITVLGDFELPVISVMADTIDCLDQNGQFITTNLSNAVYFWAGQGFTSFDQNPVFEIEGNYTLTVTGTNGCQVSSVHYLPASKNFPSLVAEIESVTCSRPNGKITLKADIPSTISWTDIYGNIGTGDIITSTVANTYSIQTTSIKGCQTSSSFSIPVDTLRPTIAQMSPALLTCTVTSVSPLVQTSTYDSFIWSGPNFKDSINLLPVILNPGSYKLTLRNDNGCESAQTYIVSEDKTKPTFTATAMDLSCKTPEATLLLTGNTNQTYFLTNSNQSIQNGYKITTPGTYVIKAINTLGCDSIISLEIKGNFDKPKINPKPISLNCRIPELWVSDSVIDPTLEYSWLTQLGLIKADSMLVNSNAKLELIAINEFGCEAKIPVNITTDFIKPDINFNGNPEIICKETFTTISALSGISNPLINWIKNGLSISVQPEINISEPGIYEVSVTNPVNGCSETKSISIVRQPELQSIDYDLDQPLCYGELGSLKLNKIVGGTAPFMALLDNVPLAQNSITTVNGGNYLLQVSDINGCTLSSNIFVATPLDFNVNAGSDTIINLNTTYQLKSTSDKIWNELSNIMWSPSATLSCENCPEPIASPIQDTEYTISIADENGCIRTDKVWVRVKFEKGFTAPNIINPESKSGNGKFTIYPVFASIASIKSLRIYDRWGNSVFDVKDIPAGDNTFGWDGTFGGRELNPGVFVWVAEIQYLDLTSEIVTGDVTIIK